MSGWGVAGLLLLVGGGVFLLLWANLRTALHDLAELEQRLMQETVRVSTWQRRFEFADEEIGRLQAELAAPAPFDTLTTAPAFSADDMAFLLREASRLG
ncbi:MAG: hypothetical protein KAX65_09375 [Caldilineaceae bacterium]|nr:hypothetical protein [Caldilineaceae bacterium]